MKKVKVKSNLDILVKNFISEYTALVQLKVLVYKQAWSIEQAYQDEREQNSEFLSKYPKFRFYIQDKVPYFDLIDYYAYKPMIIVDKENILNNISNVALDHIRRKCMVRGELKGKEIFGKKSFTNRLDKLPKDRIIGLADVLSVFDDLGRANKNPADSKEIKAKVRNDPPYSHNELDALTKNGTISLCIKVQKKWIKECALNEKLTQRIEELEKRLKKKG